MRAVLFPGDRQVLVERPYPSPVRVRSLVQTRASAICRSDMGLYTGNSAIVGGDSAGKGLISPRTRAGRGGRRCGPATQRRQVGDRVAGYLPIGCGHCEYCHSGYLMLCPEWKCLGFDVDGGDADYLVLPERMPAPARTRSPSSPAP